jgi:hypothetical protein
LITEYVSLFRSNKYSHGADYIDGKIDFFIRRSLLTLMVADRRIFCLLYTENEIVLFTTSSLLPLYIMLR